MTKLLSIFLSLYIFAGTVILPKGDFGFISQIPRLYDRFVQANGNTSIDDFLDEELLDPYFLSENDRDQSNEPNEKECHPVNIDLIMVNANSTFYMVVTEVEINQPEATPARSYITYTESYMTTDLDPLFHPPEPIVIA